MSREREPDLVVDADNMSLKEKERLTAQAKSMTEALLEATDLLGGTPWCLVHEKHGISLFRAEGTADAPCNVHAVCKFTSDIEDVAESMITSTTETYKNMMSMLSSDFIDGAVIQNIVEPTELYPHRYVALKWAAFRSSSRFSKDRDFIILEYVDMIEDDQGQKIAFRIMESVDVPNNSPFAESPKYTRDVVPLMGFMYHTTKKPSELRLTYTCNFDKNGDLPAWAANSAIQSHVEKCVNGILKYIETFRATREEIVLPQQVIPMGQQGHCHICERNFCVLRRKYNCLKCGEVICSNCSSLRTTKVPDVGERQLRVCTACVIAARRSSRTAGLSLTDASGCLSSPVPSLRSPSTATVDTDVSSIQSVTPSPVCRAQSFSQGKRRSFDNLLDPVRSRLIEYKNFADGAEVLSIPKATFPVRSFSDGIMRKGNLFAPKRRGSPADLAISLEAFRQHQLRMGTSDAQGETEMEEDEESDEEVMQSLQHFSSTSSSSSSSAASDDADESPRHIGHAGMPESPTSHAVFHEAAGKVSGLIEATEYNHHLAQNLAHHMRKLSHHRVVALQQEHQALIGIRSTDRKEDAVRTAGRPELDTAELGTISPARVRRVVCQTRDGTVLYGKTAMDMAMEADMQGITRGIAELPSNQCVDAGYLRGERGRFG
ncbi:hypothetical protein ATCC90586_006298 [Pythium insidiosum]|nr:hypothetical protein ATCC90586_006298 [Pythium insidiosum]